MAKIPWSRIREAFEGEWIELTNYAWKPEHLHPDAGHVRNHNSNRKELLKTIARLGRVDGAVVLFVGSSLPVILSQEQFESRVGNL